MKYQVIAVALALVATAAPAKADLMSVDDLSTLIQQGDEGKRIATAYFQGVVEGYVAFENMRRMGNARPKEFCKLLDNPYAPSGLPHPAANVPLMVDKWISQGRDRDAPAPDLVLNLLSGTYGCK